MKKYSTEFKMKIVQEYLNKEDQLSNVKRKYLEKLNKNYTTTKY